MSEYSPLTSPEKVVPIDEAHQEWLGKKKVGLQLLRDRWAIENAVQREETDARNERLAGTRELTNLRIANGEEIAAAFQESLIIQTDLINRIASSGSSNSN